MSSAGQAPQGDASAAPAPATEEAPVPEADMQAAAPDPMGVDPNMGAGIGNMAEDPNAAAPAEGDPMAGGEEGMESTEAPAEGGDDDSTAGIIDQLSDEDKEAVRNYAKSLLNRDEAATPEAPGAEEPAPAPDQGQGGVMMEITKGRLKRVQRHLNEKFRENDRDDEPEDRKQKKVHKKNLGSPFNKPVKW